MSSWQFHEPISGDTYVFEISPNTSSGTTLQRRTRYANRSALDFSAVAGITRADAREEDCSGILLSSAQYYALAEWFNLGKVIELTDDLDRTSNVIITGFDPKRQRKRDYPWYHQFTLKYVVLETGPVAVPDFPPPPVLAAYGPPTGTTMVIVENNRSHTALSTDLGMTWSPGDDQYSNFFYWDGTQWWLGGTNFLASSPDGVTWTGHGTFPSGSTYPYGMAYNGTTYVVVGEIYVPADSRYYAAAYSTDGITWTIASTTLTFGDEVAWNGSLFVMTGANDDSTYVIETSPDGINWTPRHSAMDDPSATGNHWGYSICYSPELSLFVVGGESYDDSLSTDGPPTMMISPNGVSWTAVSNPYNTAVDTAGYVADVEWNGEQFVAVGYGPCTVATSPDGVTWTQQSTPWDATPTGYGAIVRWDGTQWWVTGRAHSYSDGSAGIPDLMSSPDGITWTNVDYGQDPTTTYTATFGFGTRPNYRYPFFS